MISHRKLVSLNNNIVVALSGGVDSAVAALMLSRDHSDISAIFMKNWDEDDGTEFCNSVQDFADAQRVCDVLKIPLTTINFAHEYWEKVFRALIRGYEQGITPNPDILCNREIKFGMFLSYAQTKGIPTIATGHYAALKEVEDQIYLYRGMDKEKDQSYFLSGVPRQQLRHCKFPLQGLTKTEVRRIAKAAKLPVHNKKDSTGICFIGKRKFPEFLSRYINATRGEIVDSRGTVLGEHEGLPYYTLGQRKGIGIGGTTNGVEAPWYVVQKLFDSNRLVITQNESDLMSTTLRACEINWLVNEPQKYVNCDAVVRYRQRPTPCTFEMEQNSVTVTFTQPQRATTPGQYVTFYHGDLCLGSAKISEVLQ